MNKKTSRIISPILIGLIYIMPHLAWGFCSLPLIKELAYCQRGKDDFQAKGFTSYSELDYVDHLSALGESYLKTPGITQLSYPASIKNYLLSLSNVIIKNNELLLNQKISPVFFIIDNPAPFYFSLPGGKIFFSIGLLKRYIKHEGLLVSILCYEIVKSWRNIYPTKIIVPTGQIITERMLAITRPSLDDKMEIHRWAYYAMKRAGFDASSYLAWIQIQNKNTLDFALHLGDAKRIAREESMFKQFVISRKDKITKNITSNSSPEFYAFMKDIGQMGAGI